MSLIQNTWCESEEGTSSNNDWAPSPCNMGMDARKANKALCTVDALLQFYPDQIFNISLQKNRNGQERRGHVLLGANRTHLAYCI